MNRYLLTAKSLSIPESWILRIGFIVAVAVAMFFLIASESELAFSFVAALCITGITHNAYCLSRSERRRTVPGMNDTAATVSIAIAIALTLLTALLTGAVRGMAMDIMGMSFVLIAYGAWFGWGERLVFWIFCIFVGVAGIATFVFSSFAVAQDFVVKLYEQMAAGQWVWTRNFFGVVCFAFGCWALRRFWRLATTTEEIQAERRLHDLVESNVNSLFAGSPEYSENAIELAIASSSLKRLRRILFGQVIVTHQGKIVVGCIAAFVAAMMIFIRSPDSTVSPMQVVCCIMICALPSVTFLANVPRSFSRTWVMGVSDSRRGTALQLLFVCIHRCSLSILILAFAICIANGTSLASWTANTFAILIALAFAGILFWFVVRWYPFWTRQSDVTVMLMLISLTLLLGGFGAVLAADNGQIFEKFPVAHQSLISYLGIPGTLFAVFLVAASIWVLSLYDGSRTLGRATELLE